MYYLQVHPHNNVAILAQVDMNNKCYSRARGSLSTSRSTNYKLELKIKHK